MPRFFVPAGAIAGGRAVIAGDDAAHLARSLRATPGERIVVADDAGSEHGVRLVLVDDSHVEGEVEWSRPATGEPSIEVHVVQAIAKDGMDELVEALAEVGAGHVWPVVTRRTVARPDARRAAQRVRRWQAIAGNAAGLAGRAHPPQVHDVLDIAAVRTALPGDVRPLACSVDAATPLARLSPPPRNGERIAVLIGPEGGLDAADVDALGGAVTRVHLGPRVVRARLAAVVAVSLLLGVAGDMDAAVAGWPESVEASP